MKYQTMTAADGRMTFAFGNDGISEMVARLERFTYHRGSHRQEKLSMQRRGDLRNFLKIEIDIHGWKASGSLGKDLATKRYLEFCGFYDVQISEDGASFSSSISVLGMKLKRRHFEMPAWLQIFLGQEKLTNRAGLTHQAVLSLWDSMKILHDYWLEENGMITAEQLAVSAITAEKLSVT